MALPSPWVRHLNPKDHERVSQFEAAVRNSTVALGRLQEILREDLATLDRAETTEGQFETPNWAYQQAYRNGQRSRIKYQLSLLEFLDQR